MPIELVAGDFTGEAEQAWIMATLSVLCGGRVWETEVPRDVEIDRATSGGVKPYIIVSFAEPFASPQGRSIAGGEQSQPHTLSFTVMAIGGDADSVRETIVEARMLLVGSHPSLTAGAIVARGGSAFGSVSAGSHPTRFQRAAFLRVPINV